MKNDIKYKEINISFKTIFYHNVWQTFFNNYFENLLFLKIYSQNISLKKNDIFSYFLYIKF